MFVEAADAKLHTIFFASMRAIYYLHVHSLVLLSEDAVVGILQ